MNDVSNFRELIRVYIRRNSSERIPTSIDHELSKAHFNLMTHFPVGWTDSNGLKGFLVKNGPQLGRHWFPLEAMRKQKQTWYPFLLLVIDEGQYYAPDGISSLRVIILAHPDDQEDSPLQGLGFRFEAPYLEKPPTKLGMHDYFHMQLCWKATKTLSIPGAQEWIPDSEPATPILIPENGIDFLFIVLLGLYGRKGLHEKFQSIKIPSLYEKFKAFEKRNRFPSA